ncbi:MAG: hypothetical protein KDE56_04810 [Anaerolineales bacterium]|nr:hypothetical protein [Anaerolineales bacterium]
MTILTQEPALHTILKQTAQLSHNQLLQLIAYLAEQAQQTAPSVEKPDYEWTDIEGIVEGNLTGMDAQEWVNKVRAEEWEREIPR